MRPHGRKPLAVPRDGIVGDIEARYEDAGKLCRAAPFGKAKERPGAFAETIDQAGLHEKTQMARNAGLRLPQNRCELGDRELRLGKKRKDAQPRSLPRGLQCRIQGLKSQLRRS